MSRYGSGATTKSDAPDSGGSPSGAGAILYPWAVNRRKSVIQNHPNSGINMSVRFNADDVGDVSLTEWDIVLLPGQMVPSPEGLYIKNVAIYFTGAGTLGTNFTVRGWD